MNITLFYHTVFSTLDFSFVTTIYEVFLYVFDKEDLKTFRNPNHIATLSTRKVKNPYVLHNPKTLCNCNQQALLIKVY